MPALAQPPEAQVRTLRGGGTAQLPGQADECSVHSAPAAHALAACAGCWHYAGALRVHAHFLGRLIVVVGMRSCRVGLLPLRKRPRDYLTWMLDKESDGIDGADGSGGSSEVKSGKQGSKRAKQQGMQQEGQQEGRAASKGRPGGSAGPGGGGNNTLQVVHKLTVKGVAKKAAPKPQSETNSAAAAAPPAGPRTTTVTFQRKREPAAGADAMLNGGSSSSMNGSSNDGTATAGAVAKGSRRLGGLAGPIGSIRSAVRTLPDSLAGT